MMAFFPTPYPDEILYSVLARYHVRAGNTSYKATILDVFGSRTATAIVDLPCNIQNLINNMPPGSMITLEEVIDDYTLLPFYGAFLPPERVKQLKHSMLSSRGGDIYSRAGIMASSIIQNRYLKFCPKCTNEDVLNYGEIYWHRFYQIPCVICPKHRIPLQNSGVLVSGFNKHEFTAANIANCTIHDEQVMLDDTLQHLLQFSLDAKYLLDNSLPNREVEWFRSQYLELLKEKGYATVNGKLYRKKLINDFIKFYNEQFLEYVQSSINPNSQTNWLTDMLHNRESTAHPVRHLLLIRFLGASISDIFYKKFHYSPFGSGPWICLNSAADHYLQPVVNELEISYGADNKEAIGTFSCDCGFVYTRNGKDHDESDQYTYTRIKKYGPVWENKLKKVVRKRLSLRETARLMDADPATIKKYAKKLELQIFCTERKDSEDSDENEKQAILYEIHKKEQYRTMWLSLQKQYPEKKRKELRLISQRVYTWLYRNDSLWLNDNSPQKRYVYINKRIDWEQRDQELLPKVQIVVQKMLNTMDKPKRISVSSIGSMLGIRALLQKHLGKLPKTKEYIDSIIENDHDYRTRRIKWAIQELIKEGNSLQVWKVLKKAGVRKKYVDDFEEEIYKLLNSIYL